jgi:lipid-binding SYLF domain-containing protein
MRCLATLFAGCVLTVAAGCVVWEPVTYSEAQQDTVEATLAAFRAEERLQPYFDGAIAYAVFPATWRAGAGFGAAYGEGWLFENGEVTGRAMMTELFVGANVGVQGYRRILFFRGEWALDQFKRGRFEFTGQANATVATASRDAKPSYHPEVAMFEQVRGGLLLEASVGTQRYDYFPLVEE